MNKQQSAAIFAAIALMIVAGAGTAFAAPGERGDGEREKRFRHGPPQEVRDAFESGDYDTWKDLVSERENSPFVDFSEADFEKLQKLHELRKAGDKEGAKEIADELGLKPKLHHKGKRGHMKKLLGNENVQDALENEDYDAFREALDGHDRFLEKLTPEKFEKILEKHKQRS